MCGIVAVVSQSHKLKSVRLQSVALPLDERSKENENKDDFSSNNDIVSD